MATTFEIRALLEDGPELPAQLAEWLEMDLPSLTFLLKQMQIPACERCGRRFLPSGSREARFCSTECDRNETTEVRATPDRRSERDAEFTGPLQAEAIPAKGLKSSAPRRDDPEFEVVWDGVGPLPGAGTAAGLGSTLSGLHFSVGRRV
jgi:hypothetical protein